MPEKAVEAFSGNKKEARPGLFFYCFMNSSTAFL